MDFVLGGGAVGLFEEGKGLLEWLEKLVREGGRERLIEDKEQRVREVDGVRWFSKDGRLRDWPFHRRARCGVLLDHRCRYFVRVGDFGGGAEKTSTR